MWPAKATAAARAALALLLLAAVAAAETKATTPVAAEILPDSSEALEYEVDNAPFAVVVEHGDGYRCGGALISLRAALSSASCALGRSPAPPADLWARALGTPSADGARRVMRVAVATDTDAQGVTYGEQRLKEPWLATVLDLALLELESQFGAAARARSILMATERAECVPRSWTSPAPAACVAVRTPLSESAQLHAAAAAPTPPDVCAARAPYWSAVADRALCFTGPQLCSSDWGVGVVCAGKLCGVVSRSVRAAAAAAAAAGSRGARADGADGCGTTHAALLVPSWRAFVHCAQTPRSCGRDSCAAVCSEQWLLEEPSGADDSGGKDGAGRGGVGGGAGGEGGGGSGGSQEGNSGSDEDVAMHLTNAEEMDTAIFSNRYTSLPSSPRTDAKEEQSPWPNTETTASPRTDTKEEQSPWPNTETTASPRTDAKEEQSPWPNTETTASPRTDAKEEQSPWPSTETTAESLENVASARRAGIGLDLPTRTSGTSALTSATARLGPLPPSPKDPPQPARFAKYNFEPNRADFKVGEYGDNAANYDTDEELLTRTSPSTTPEPRAAEALQEPSTTDAAALRTTAAPHTQARELTDAAARPRALPILAPAFCIFHIRIFR